MPSQNDGVQEEVARKIGRWLARGNGGGRWQRQLEAKASMSKLVEKTKQAKPKRPKEEVIELEQINSLMSDIPQMAADDWRHRHQGINVRGMDLRAIVLAESNKLMK